MAEQLGLNVNQVVGKINKMREAGLLPPSRLCVPRFGKRMLKAELH